MSEMIERVARALYAQDSTQAEVAGYKLASVWEYEPKRHDAYFKLARAAIAAMREPTPEMEDAGFNAGGEGENEMHEYASPERTWIAMIDAILNKRED